MKTKARSKRVRLFSTGKWLGTTPSAPQLLGSEQLDIASVKPPRRQRHKLFANAVHFPDSFFRQRSIFGFNERTNFVYSIEQLYNYADGLWISLLIARSCFSK